MFIPCARQIWILVSKDGKTSDHFSLIQFWHDPISWLPRGEIMRYSLKLSLEKINEVPNFFEEMKIMKMKWKIIIPSPPCQRPNAFLWLWRKSHSEMFSCKKPRDTVGVEARMATWRGRRWHLVKHDNWIKWGNSISSLSRSLSFTASCLACQLVFPLKFEYLMRNIKHTRHGTIFHLWSIPGLPGMNFKYYYNNLNL